MFTVRFFDILTGVQSVSHPIAHNRKLTNKTGASKRIINWFKR